MAVTRYTRDMVGRSQRGDVFVLETEYMKLCAENARLTAELAGNGVLIAEQNKLLAERQEWALRTNEIIRGLNAELSDRASPEMVFTLKATIRQLTDELAEATAQQAELREALTKTNDALEKLLSAPALRPASETL